LGFWTRSDEKDARLRAEAAGLVKSLGATEAQTRAVAAIGLRSFLDNEHTRDLVIDSLATGLGLEAKVDVQQAMAESLVAAGASAVPSLRRMLTRVNGEVQIAFNRVGPGTCEERKAELEPVRARQRAMVEAALALRQIRSAGRAAVPADFSNLNFKCFEFHGVPANLQQSSFRGTILWDADFYRVDLRNADFTEARAFGTRFQRANLASAKFAGATLDAANFSDATGLAESQLKAAATLLCAKFDPPLAADLAAQTKPPEGQVCRP
jgi:hypothetical protein